MIKSLPIGIALIACLWNNGIKAQSQLTVNCYPTVTPFNSYSIDENIMEYGPVGTDPSFCVVVIDSATCTPWQTAFGGQFQENDFGNVNQNGNGKGRSELFFQFQQTDSLQLAGMLGMLNQVPNGYFVTVFTTVDYNYQQVNALAPDLIQYLQNRWDAGVITSGNLMVLHGIQGNETSAIEDTTFQTDHISFTTPICDGVTEIAETTFEPVVKILGDGSVVITSLYVLTDIRLTNPSGMVLPFRTELNGEQTQLFPMHVLPEGVYMLSLRWNGIYHTQRFIVNGSL